MGFFNKNKKNEKGIDLSNISKTRLDYLKVEIPPIKLEDEAQKKRREEQIDLIVSSMPIAREYDTFEEDLEEVLYLKGYDQYEGENDDNMHLLTLLPLEVEILKKMDTEIRNGNIKGLYEGYLQSYSNYIMGKIKAEILRKQMKEQSDKIEIPDIKKIIEEEMEEQKNSKR